MERCESFDEEDGEAFDDGKDVGAGSGSGTTTCIASTSSDHRYVCIGIIVSDAQGLCVAAGIDAILQRSNASSPKHEKDGATTTFSCSPTHRSLHCDLRLCPPCWRAHADGQAARGRAGYDHALTEVVKKYTWSAAASFLAILFLSLFLGLHTSVPSSSSSSSRSFPPPLPSPLRPHSVSHAGVVRYFQE